MTEAIRVIADRVARRLLAELREGLHTAVGLDEIRKALAPECPRDAQAYGALEELTLRRVVVLAGAGRPDDEDQAS